MPVSPNPPSPTPGGSSGPGAEPTPRVRGFALGPYETNCYIVSVPGSRDCWLVDCGFDPGEMLDEVEREGLQVRAIVLTHAHMDHIAGLSEARRRAGGAPVLIHQAEADWLGDPLLNLSAMGGVPVSLPGPDGVLVDGQRLELAGTTWRVVHTPGHSPGGVTLVHDASGQALVGDALFAGSVGRMDLPGGDEATLVQSIRERLYALPDETRVYPGHGPTTTIGREKRSNPFVRG